MPWEAFGGGSGGGGGGGNMAQYSFVYQPGGVAGLNVYVTWAALYAALNAAAPASANGNRPPTVIQIDDSFVSPAVVPAGAYNLDQVTLQGSFNAGPAATLLNLAVGVTLTQPANGIMLRIQGGLVVTYLDAVPCMTNVAGQLAHVHLRESAELICAGAGAFVSATGGTVTIACVLATVGDGVHTVAVGVAPGVVSVTGYLNSTITANAVTGGKLRFLGRSHSERARRRRHRHPGGWLRARDGRKLGHRAHGAKRRARHACERRGQSRAANERRRRSRESAHLHRPAVHTARQWQGARLS